MRVWIDADACPRAAKDLVVKFALKRQVRGGGGGRAAADQAGAGDR